MWRVTEQPADVQEKREQILRAARSAIAEKGAESVRLIDIAQVAGVSIGALQHHFGSRDSLVLDAYRLQGQDAMAAATPLAADTVDPWEALVAVIRFLGGADDEDNDAAAWIELCATAVRIPALQEVVDLINTMWADLVTGIVERGLRTGTFTSPLDPAALSDALLVLLDGMELTISSRREPPSRVTRAVTQAAAALVGIDATPTGRRRRAN